MTIRATGALLATMLTLAGLVYAQAGGQPPDRVRDNAKRSRGLATADPNIKAARPSNRADAPLPAPPNKGGPPSPTARGVSVCAVIFDNYTGWPIDTYTDREFTGTVPAWGDLKAYAIAGGTRIYAIVEFTDGSSLTWGPRNIYCGANGSFTWGLHPASS